MRIVTIVRARRPSLPSFNPPSRVSKRLRSSRSTISQRRWRDR